MTQKDKAVIDMSDSGLVHVQPEFQAVFEYATTLLPDGFCLCFSAFDNEDKIIGIATVRHSGFPLPVNGQQPVSEMREC